MESTARTLLSPFYYLHNFQYLLSFVEKKSGHILSQSEIKFINDFQLLSKQEQALYVRMFNRKGLFFNINKFDYSEIRSVKSSTLKLITENFASVLSSEDSDQLIDVLRIFTKDELCNIFYKCSHKKNKSLLNKRSDS
jgi:hypothetical protein